ncbi:MAG TPA: hypothetical protein VMY59_09825 [Candidatus Thermoplasmatota archaeon]|nr:hypothetical protein [Candidatus Thermoplasmatota archaeon]
MNLDDVDELLLIIKGLVLTIIHQGPCRSEVKNPYITLAIISLVP